MVTDRCDDLSSEYLLPFLSMILVAAFSTRGGGSLRLLLARRDRISEAPKRSHQRLRVGGCVSEARRGSGRELIVERGTGLILSRACVCWRVEMDSSEAGCRPVVMPPLLDGWWPGDEDDATGYYGRGDHSLSWTGGCGCGGLWMRVESWLRPTIR